MNVCRRLQSSGGLLADRLIEVSQTRTFLVTSTSMIPTVRARLVSTTESRSAWLFFLSAFHRHKRKLRKEDENRKKHLSLPKGRTAAVYNIASAFATVQRMMQRKEHSTRHHAQEQMPNCCISQQHKERKIRDFGKHKKRACALRAGKRSCFSSVHQISTNIYIHEALCSSVDASSAASCSSR